MTQISRRQVLTGTAVAATAWVIPEILVAKPSAGAQLSAEGAPSPAVPMNQAPPPPKPQPAVEHPSNLAYTGLNIQRDTEVGAALIAGGWALHHWAARQPSPEPSPNPERLPR